jgi:hypothetical protein
MMTPVEVAKRPKAVGACVTSGDLGSRANHTPGNVVKLCHWRRTLTDYLEHKKLTSNSKLSEWLTIATNIGVIVGLIFITLEYRQNNELLVVESSANRASQSNSFVDLVIQDPTLIELLNKNSTELSKIESDRLTLLGIRLLLLLEAQYEATVAGHGFPEAQLRDIHRAIYRRESLNYGVPYAWLTFKSRGETDFTRWFETEVINP